MNRQTVSSGTVWEELAGFSRAVRVGNHIFVSGTTATGADGNVIGDGDAAAQTRFIIDKIESASLKLGGKPGKHRAHPYLSCATSTIGKLPHVSTANALPPSAPPTPWSKLSWWAKNIWWKWKQKPFSNLKVASCELRIASKNRHASSLTAICIHGCAFSNG